MPDELDSDRSPETLSPREQAILEFYAAGLDDREIAARLRMTRREISSIRSHAASTLTARIASAHPFRIREVVLAGSLHSAEL